MHLVTRPYQFPQQPDHECHRPERDEKTDEEKPHRITTACSLHDEKSVAGKTVPPENLKNPSFGGLLPQTGQTIKREVQLQDIDPRLP